MNPNDPKKLIKISCYRCNSHVGSAVSYFIAVHRAFVTAPSATSRLRLDFHHIKVNLKKSEIVQPLVFTDLINSFRVKQNVTGPTHHFNHTVDLIISHGIDLTDIDILPQSDYVTDHFLVLCMLHITDINYMALRYRPGRIFVPATKDRSWA